VTSLRRFRLQSAAPTGSEFRQTFILPPASADHQSARGCECVIETVGFLQRNDLDYTIVSSISVDFDNSEGGNDRTRLFVIDATEFCSNAEVEFHVLAEGSGDPEDLNINRIATTIWSMTPPNETVTFRVGITVKCGGQVVLALPAAEGVVMDVDLGGA